MTFSRFFILLAFLCALPFTNNAYAYFSTMDTGDILPSGQYKLGVEPQYVSDPSGLNLNSFFDAGVTESSNIRVVAGVGSVSFNTGLFYKWVPIPDYQNQPAVGLMVGGTWARYKSENYPSVRFHPIVSKAFDTNIGLLTPFAALPFGITAGPSRNTYPMQLAVGSDWKPDGLEKVHFMVEMGLNLNEAFSYVSVASVIYFDDENGFIFK
ncbi:MAG: hypothetical protein AB7F59_15495 [Bdellovibrionales bacterium]